jgi:hypothetical protein
LATHLELAATQSPAKENNVKPPKYSIGSKQLIANGLLPRKLGISFARRALKLSKEKEKTG